MTKPKNSPALDMAALAVLGLDPKEIKEKVIERIADRVLQGYGCDEDGEYVCDSAFKRKLDARIAAQVDAAINAMAEAHVLPNVASYIENLTLQKTNSWGEKAGGSKTFIEYLVERCDFYMREEVNYEGKPKGTDGFSWTGRTTRVAYMIDKHLHSSIEQAMKSALERANSSIAEGLKKAVEIAIDNIKTNLKVITDTKSR
jgi:hypothetical protein